jgi:hypothetical protein
MGILNNFESWLDSIVLNDEFENFDLQEDIDKIVD